MCNLTCPTSMEYSFPSCGCTRCGATPGVYSYTNVGNYVWFSVCTWHSALAFPWLPGTPLEKSQAPFRLFTSEQLRLSMGSWGFTIFTGPHNHHYSHGTFYYPPKKPHINEQPLLISVCQPPVRTFHVNEPGTLWSLCLASFTQPEVSSSVHAHFLLMAEYYLPCLRACATFAVSIDQLVDMG